MPEKRRHSIPIIYANGSHYDVGFDIGRTFGSLINSHVDGSTFLKDDLIPLYEKPEGKKIYDDVLEACNNHFPQYVREIQGTADGAKVPFFKLFLLHTDFILPNIMSRSVKPPTTQSVKGCSDVTVNLRDAQLLGHNEDTVPKILNHHYLVSLHITEKQPQGIYKTTEEHFTAFCYAGFIPGFCFGFNVHGFANSINVIDCAELLPRIPRFFLCRAALAASSIEQVKEIMYDEGVGIAEGVHLNCAFMKGKSTEFWSVEVAPNKAAHSSTVNAVKVPSGEKYIHTNKFLRIKIAENTNEIDYASSNPRQSTFKQLPSPTDFHKLVQVLGDQSNGTYNLFREGEGEDWLVTIASAVFDFNTRKLSVWVDNPKRTSPLCVHPIDMK